MCRAWSPLHSAPLVPTFPELVLVTHGCTSVSPAHVKSSRAGSLQVSVSIPRAGAGPDALGSICPAHNDALDGPLHLQGASQWPLLLFDLPPTGAGESKQKTDPSWSREFSPRNLGVGKEKPGSIWAVHANGAVCTQELCAAIFCLD